MLTFDSLQAVSPTSVTPSHVDQGIDALTCCTDSCGIVFTNSYNLSRHERVYHRVFHSRTQVSRRGDSSDSSPAPDSDSSLSNTPLQSPQPSPLPSPQLSPQLSPQPSTMSTPSPTASPRSLTPPSPLSSASMSQSVGGGSSSGSSGSISQDLRCKSCFVVFASRRYHRQHQCRFKYDPNISLDQSVTFLTKPKNLETTLQTLSLLSDVDIVKMARLQDWWIPQLYPFVFPGKLRSGHQGLPPVLKNCTAENNSTKLLQLFLRVEGRTNLPRIIVLIHEDGSRSLLPEAVLTPPVQSFNYDVNPSVFTVSAGIEGQSDQTSTDQTADDTGDNDDINDGVVARNPSRPRSQAAAVLDLNNERRFYPGIDGYGSLHIERRKMSPFCQSWQFKDDEIQVYTRMTKLDFFEFERSCRGSTLRKASLNMYAQALLFNIKLCHDLPFSVLGSLFSVDRTTAENVFYRIALHQFINNSNIPNILSPDGQVNAAEVDKMLQSAYNNMEPYYKELLKDVKDPSGRDRVGVALNVDGTYLGTTSSEDTGKKDIYIIIQSKGHLFLLFQSFRSTCFAARSPNTSSK